MPKPQIVITQPAPKRADSFKNAVICAVAAMVFAVLYVLAEKGVFG